MIRPLLYYNFSYIPEYAQPCDAAQWRNKNLSQIAFSKVSTSFTSLPQVSVNFARTPCIRHGSNLEPSMSTKIMESWSGLAIDSVRTYGIVSFSKFCTSSSNPNSPNDNFVAKLLISVKRNQGVQLFFSSIVIVTFFISALHPTINSGNRSKMNEMLADATPSSSTQPKTALILFSPIFKWLFFFFQRAS